MSKRCNGYIRNSLELYEPEEGTDGNLSSDFEKIFRGFEKVPLVVCQRHDIKPYLNKMELDLPPDVSEMKRSENEPFPTLTNLLKECFVVLERQNLEQLKELCISNWKKDQINIMEDNQENKHILYSSKTKSRKRVSFSDTVIIHEVKKYNKCLKCPKIFEHYNSLKAHVTQIHKKRKSYICFYCSKDFIDRTLFKLHIKLHCDSCGLLLSNKKHFLEHRRTTCKTVKKYECKTCHIILFYLMDLRDHSYEHSGTIFICDVCKEKFETRRDIKHHIRFLHSKSMISVRKNGLDREFLSNCCKETFRDKELVEKRVSVFPDDERCVGFIASHVCDQCNETFNTETEMLQHKWTHFLKSEEKRSEKILTPVTYNVHDQLPSFLQPKLVLEKMVLPDKLEASFNGAVENFNCNGQLKRPIIDPITKRTIISRHQCERCGKYLSSNSSLTRHMLTVHGVGDHGNRMQCNVSRKMVWPQFQSHRCDRMLSDPTCMRPDLRPDQHSLDQNSLNQHNIDQYIDLTHMDDEDYMNSLDFDIPPPIVELTEYENMNIYMNNTDGRFDFNSKDCSLNNVNYKIVFQEVPIEFE